MISRTISSVRNECVRRNDRRKEEIKHIISGTRGILQRKGNAIRSSQVGHSYLTGFSLDERVDKRDGEKKEIER